MKREGEDIDIDIITNIESNDEQYGVSRRGRKRKSVNYSELSDDDTEKENKRPKVNNSNHDRRSGTLGRAKSYINRCM